ncbi:hypothetical protein PQU96_01630 [Vogesella sp. LYT5W]|uniref:Uncharacterized protein n=1 Tax=Vogesella margarita TaxID=2984199 RepID=A0ABT5IJZ5_9NEIS|nr:hypothetical protein [Vogesella margarita]MDC7712832.1 hypothetical protein [Vogesella margarita]
MSHTIETIARRAAVTALLLFGICLYLAYQESVPLALGWVIASHLLLTLSAGVFKLSVVVVMACRHGRRHAV